LPAAAAVAVETAALRFAAAAAMRSAQASFGPNDPDFARGHTHAFKISAC
jgi:hypothetical protein